jgi:hypothetical protein
MSTIYTCCVLHPTSEGHRCARIEGHAGNHAVYTFSIRTPEEWADDDTADDGAVTVLGVLLRLWVVVTVRRHAQAVAARSASQAAPTSNTTTPGAECEP